MAATDDLETALRRLSRRGPLVIVKCGPDGARALQKGKVLHVPGLPVQVKDTTGAGDSFDAGFIFAHLFQAASLRRSLCFANVCGALCITGIGGTAAQPTLEQAQAFLKQARCQQVASR
jgi:sugar/nucleoside kinase (ribokinase family)